MFAKALMVLSCCASLLAAESLSRDQAAAELQRQWRAKLETLKAERAGEMQSNILTHAEKTLRWAERVFGEAPTNGRSLWISMHGGGGAPARVNDRQWTNQIS